MSDVRARETGEGTALTGASWYADGVRGGGTAEQKTIGLRLRNDSRNTGSDSGIPVAPGAFGSINFFPSIAMNSGGWEAVPFDCFHGEYKLSQLLRISRPVQVSQLE